MPRQLELSIPRRIAFFLLSGFSLNALSFAIKPLRTANLLSPTLLYHPVIYALTAEKIASEEGPRVAPEETMISPDHPPHLVLVCASAHECLHPGAIVWLREQADRSIPLGGITSGCLLLAEAGLLANYRHVVPPKDHPWVSDHPVARYEVDRDRMTCNSAIAALEMMVNLIATEHGSQTAYQVRQRLVEEGLHPALSERDALVKERLAQHAPRLLMAIRLMEASRETPLAPSELARRIGLSLRHFERLFQEHCQCSPRQYYLGVRLDHARALLQNTDMSVGNISRAIGLESASYFSRRYRERFGFAPTKERF